jgi:chromate reductase, NAD(P)H dehydrogenase (quinone)
MSTPRKVAVFVGSLRKDSLTRKLAHALVGMAPEPLQLEIVEIGALPHYNADDETDPSPAVRDFRSRVAAADALLFVTPEYNRSVPGVLKNALDVGSRPSGKSSWQGKPGAVVSVSPGPLGGFGANHALRQSMVFLNVPMLQMPEAYIGNAAALFDAEGALVNDSTRGFLRKFLEAFAQWIDRNVPR